MKIKQSITFGKTELTNATRDLYASLTTIFQHYNFKYIKTSRRRSSNYFFLFYILFISLFPFSLTLFKLSCAKKHHVYNLYRISYTLSFCYVMYYIVSETCIGGRYLEDCFYCCSQSIISVVANEYLKPNKKRTRSTDF